MGITEWLRIAALAHSFNASVSPHLMMEIHVHLVCATPNALFVEQVPMLERFLQHPLQIEGGYAVPPERPGHGVAFDQDKVKRLLPGEELLAVKGQGLQGTVGPSPARVVRCMMRL